MPPVIVAALDAEHHAPPEPVELADLDGRAERARAKFEPQLLIGVARLGLTKPTMARLSAANPTAYM
jgi:hypothetical protein